MRYIRQQKFITTVVNEEIDNAEEAGKLLRSLKNSSADISFSYRDHRSDSVVSVKTARIIDVEENSTSIRSFSGAGSSLTRHISFKNIIEVRLVTETDNIMVDDKHITKFDLLDIESDEKLD